MCFVLILINFEPKKQQFLTKPWIFFAKIARTLIFPPPPSYTLYGTFIHPWSWVVLGLHWTKNIYQKSLEVFKNSENVNNVEKYIKMAISRPYGHQMKMWRIFFPSSSFIVEENDSSFIFWICGVWAEI